MQANPTADGTAVTITIPGEQVAWFRHEIALVANDEFNGLAQQDWSWFRDSEQLVEELAELRRLLALLDDVTWSPAASDEDLRDGPAVETPVTFSMDLEWLDGKLDSIAEIANGNIESAIFEDDETRPRQALAMVEVIRAANPHLATSRPDTAVGEAS